MTTTILSNKKYYSTQVHMTANASIVVAGAVATSNIATGDEVITGGNISQAVWGVDAGGSIQVRRNSNLVAIFTQSGAMDYAGSCLSLTLNNTSNVDVTFVGSANSYLLLEIQKIVPQSNSNYFRS